MRHVKTMIAQITQTAILTYMNIGLVVKNCRLDWKYFEAKSHPCIGIIAITQLPIDLTTFCTCVLTLPLSSVWLTDCIKIMLTACNRVNNMRVYAKTALLVLWILTMVATDAITKIQPVISPI
jgi:hypothetical protein